MTTLYKYRIYCTTDNVDEYTWGESEPTKCPTNSMHDIDISKTVIVDERDENVVIIKEEDVPTGGHWKSETLSIMTPAGETTTTNVSWPFPISMLSVNYVTTNDHEGDILNIKIAPETIIGNITTDVNISDTVIHVSQTVIDNLDIGFKVCLDDGVTKNELGYVLNVNKTNNTITVQIPTSDSFDSATPTFIKQTIYLLENYELGFAGQYKLNENKIGGTYLPSGTVIQVTYKNNGITQHKFIAKMEFLY